ncbi:MAG: (d)CMP kinase [Planctomycetota bacterium]
MGFDRRARLIVTIDGPAGAGKSSVAKAVAQRLGLRYLDTGAMYRAVTWKALDERVDLENEKYLRRIADTMRLELPENGRVIVDGRDVTREIRTPAVTRETYHAAQSRLVRERLWELQRAFGAQGCVAEGRDMGTVVFPNADKKIYLDAAPEVRAQRRRKQLAETQAAPPLDDVLNEVKERDRKDLTRDVAPLAKADDAEYVDTSDLTFDEVVDLIVKKVREGGGPSNG